MAVAREVLNLADTDLSAEKQRGSRGATLSDGASGIGAISECAGCPDSTAPLW
jgi:hypothetical protein